MVVVGGHSQGTGQAPVCHAVLLRVLLASPLQRYPRASMRSSGHRITEQLSSSFCSSFFKDPRYLFPCCRPSTKCREARAGPLWVPSMSHPSSLLTSRVDPAPQLGLVGLAFLGGVSGPALLSPFCCVELGRAGLWASSAVQLPFWVGRQCPSRTPTFLSPSAVCCTSMRAAASMTWTLPSGSPYPACCWSSSCTT